MNQVEVNERMRGLADADYRVGEGDVEPNREAQKLRDLLRTLRHHEDRLDIAWCGAAIAQIFRQHPWLQIFQLDLWTESVYNDEGGSFMAHYARFRDIVACPGAEVPHQLKDADGLLDLDAASDLLDTEHEDEEFELCAPFIASGNSDSCMLALDRGVLAPLLAASAVSGLTVARLLWPDHGALRSFDQQSPTTGAAIAGAESPA